MDDIYPRKVGHFNVFAILVPLYLKWHVAFTDGAQNGVALLLVE